MRFELDLLRDSVTPTESRETTPDRRAIRETTDALIHNALLVNELPELVRLSAETMCAVATALLRYGRDPQVPDFVQAAQALIEDGRAVMDRGLMLHDWPTAECGAVMIEITVRGICAALSVPYDKVLAEVHRARLAGENAAVRAILVETGCLKPTDDELAAMPADTPPLENCMQPHQQRVVDEKTELDKKAHALSQFIGIGDIFPTLDAAEQERLREQNDVMWRYSEILGARIAAFQAGTAA